MSEALFVLHEGLPRQGPGSSRATLEVLTRLRPHLPVTPRVADFGCGSGASTLTLAKALGVPVLALDIHPPFLDSLERRALESGLADCIEAAAGDMAEPPVDPGTLDLIWSEGAIYLIGFEAGLRRWRPLLAPKGLVAVSELTWLDDERSPDVVDFWRDAYPDMGSIADNRVRARAAGYDVVDAIPLPAADWWEDYYAPLLVRCAALAPEAGPDLAAVITETRREIALFERYAQTYGYVFYLLQRGGA